MNHPLSADFLIVGAAALSRDLMGAGAGNFRDTLASLLPLVSPSRFFTQGAIP